MAQIISITSEALQSTIRRLLPSQQGFGEDLQASNVILPVLDITPTAEGSSVPDYLQTSWDFATEDTTTSNETKTLTSTSGFYKVDSLLSVGNVNSGKFSVISINNGFATKDIFRFTMPGTQLTAQPLALVQENIFYVFLRPGDSLTAQTNDANLFLNTWHRQIADVNGNLVSPLGFDPQ